MKKLRLVAVGKLKERYFADAFSEYARRIGRFADFSVVETRESRSESVEEEAADILAALSGTVFLFPEAYHGEPARPTKSVDQELLALADWSALEQESYNLSFELYSGRQALAELSSVRIQEEY